MNRKGKNREKNVQQKKDKPSYKGPYQVNPNLQLQNIKKSMRPEADGPTVNTFSSLDSTTNVLPNEENDIRQLTHGIKRPTKEKKSLISLENALIIFVGFVAAGIGLIVYTHGNKFVAVEKDIDYLKGDSKEQKELIKSIDEKAIIIDKKVDLLNQKVDFNTGKTNLR